MIRTRRSLLVGAAAAALARLAPPGHGEAVAVAPPQVLLGRRNTARTTTTLENSGPGPALAVRGSGAVALSVMGNAHINGRLSVWTGLNADKLDGLDSTAFARALHEHPYARANHSHLYAPYDHVHPPDYDGALVVFASYSKMWLPDSSERLDTLTLPHGLSDVWAAHVELNWWEAVFDSAGNGSWARRSEMAGLVQVDYYSDVPLFHVPRVYWTALDGEGITIRARAPSYQTAQYLVRVRIWVDRTSGSEGIPAPRGLSLT